MGYEIKSKKREVEDSIRHKWVIKQKLHIKPTIHRQRRTPSEELTWNCQQENYLKTSCRTCVCMGDLGMPVSVGSVSLFVCCLLHTSTLASMLGTTLNEVYKCRHWCGCCPYTCTLIKKSDYDMMIQLLKFNFTSLIVLAHWDKQGWRPRWLSWMHRPTGDQRSRVHPPPRSATFFRGDWSWNIFYGHSLPSADSRRAVVSFWRKNVHNTG